MNNKNKGVTFITLVVIIATMLILISIVGFYSLENVKNSYTAREKREFANVVDYVNSLRAKLLAGTFKVDNDIECITPERLIEIAKPLNNAQITAIVDVNTSDEINDDYKYFYITPQQLEERKYSDGSLFIKGAQNGYIINYYTGTVIAIYDDSRMQISGSVKGLSYIMDGE